MLISKESLLVRYQVVNTLASSAQNEVQISSWANLAQVCKKLVMMIASMQATEMLRYQVVEMKPLQYASVQCLSVPSVQRNIIALLKVR